MLTAAYVVEVLQAVEAAKRIPDLYKGITYYGADDLWYYEESEHPNMCDDCAGYAGTTYPGSSLRSTFPYHEILDENHIAAKVHPHCGCSLVRVFPVSI